MSHQEASVNWTYPWGLQLPVSQVTKLGEKHVGDGTEVLFCFIVTELHEDQLLVSDVRGTADHQSSFLWDRRRDVLMIYHKRQPINLTSTPQEAYDAFSVFLSFRGFNVFCECKSSAKLKSPKSSSNTSSVVGWFFHIKMINPYMSRNYAKCFNILELFVLLTRVKPPVEGMCGWPLFDL